jgi:hypothetical protein
MSDLVGVDDGVDQDNFSKDASNLAPIWILILGVT